jgi:methionyl aminopeptidase
MEPKTVQHYNWKFDYPSKCYFEPYSEMADTRYFKCSDLPIEENELKTQMDCYRKAASIHRIARSEGKKMLQPNIKYKDVVDTVEKTILRCFKIDPLDYYKNIGKYESGIAFPVGLSVNNIMAHDTALYDDERILDIGDVVKLDIGVHCNGYIIDSAFTHIVGESEYNEIYKPLLNATADATYSAIAMAGPDVRLYEMSEIISEIISSYEIEDINGNTCQINPVKGLGGHNVLRNEVHGGDLILSYPDEKHQEGMKMKENCTYAIETYASTGFGDATQCGDLSHFSFNEDKIYNNKWYKNYCKKSETGFNKWLEQRRKLPFSMAWIGELGAFDKKTEKMFRSEFKDLLDTNILIGYPPLVDNEKARTSQLEHTIYIRENGVDILSLGSDY